MLRARNQVAGEGVRLGDIVLRNRLLTSSSLLGYGVTRSNQMVTQYHWVTKRSGLLSLRHR